MKKVLSVLALAAALSNTAFADDWTGNLVDGVCAFGAHEN